MVVGGESTFFGKFSSPFYITGEGIKEIKWGFRIFEEWRGMRRCRRTNSAVH